MELGRAESASGAGKSANAAERWDCGRRPKHDDFDDLEPFENEDEDAEEDDSEEDENEEVDFDNPKFKKTDIWNDYAEDLDFEE
jgi:hypothetical protein